MNSNLFLLVEDNPRDEYMILHEFRKHRIANPVLVIRDGAEALDYLYCKHKYADRDPNDLPQIVLLDISLPKVNGLEVLQRIRGEQHTRFLSVVILTSSENEQDLFTSFERGANAFLRKPMDFTRFGEAVERLGLFFMVVKEAAPE